jgi:outer membrane receptor protein involved in Fe transport
MSAIVAASAASTPAFAQDQETPVQTVVVTGSRIINQDYQANSPLMTVSAEQVTKNQDITLDTFLNTLPQVNPAGTTTSNNPGNSGQSNIDLRGLGANRNLVLIDGRRAMVSSSTLSVDLNTVPQVLIDNIEIITGGAGAVYGADAVAGVVNLKLKDNFQGMQFSGGWSNSAKHWDAREYNASVAMGSNFADDRGNAVLAFEYSDREPLIKSQRSFAALATATTSFLPEGLYFPSGNAPSQAAVDSMFAKYGVAAGAVPRSSSLIGFNLDGTLFSRGIFNSRIDVQNFKYPIDLSVNTRLYPDVYSYNFDSVNILVSPLERRAGLMKFRYNVSDSVEMFSMFGYTNYTAENALAPTPIATVTTRATGQARTAGEATSAYLAPGKSVASLLIVPVTNPFIPADFAQLLASRTTPNSTFLSTGSAATEPFLMRQRTLDAGLRTSGFDNTVTQYLLGFRGSLPGSWKWEAYASEGRTRIETHQSGNIDTARLLGMLAAPDGGKSLCAGGFNPFGRQPISAACRQYLQVSNTLTRDFKDQIVEGFVSGNVASLPAGDLSLVLGGEYRGFRYNLDPGAAAGPISGFNVQNPAGGTNRFEDLFTEAFFPIVKDVPFVKALDATIGYRYSKTRFTNTIGGGDRISGSNNTYKLELSWLPLDTLRFRGSFQRAVRAPNFSELFDGGGSNPQYYDPCSVTSAVRTGPNAAQLLAICRDAGEAGGLGGAVNSYVQTPGTQVALTLGSNTALKPETADTFTLGAVYQPDEGIWSKLHTSVDYYHIKLKDALISPDPNLFVADCYNYYGRNPTYSPGYINCTGLFRAGGDILGVDNPLTSDGTFQFRNDGKIQTDGLDVVVNWSGTDIGPGSLSANLAFNYLFSWKQQATSALPEQNFAGTITFFGAGDGLGQTFPKKRATLSTQYKFFDKFGVDVRTRYIDSMKNRASVLYPGETFKGVGSVVYWDLGVSWEFMEKSVVRIGVNNVMDKQPPLYQPNVQSGTDPSTYDVIGRRLFARVDVKF